MTKSMNRIELLLRGWDYCYDEEGWSPPLKDALNGVTAEQANWRPAGEHVNTIWETVEHLIYYKERLLQQLTNQSDNSPAVDNDSTFAVQSSGEDGWQAAQTRMREVHQALRDHIAAWTDADFDRPIPKNLAGDWVSSLIQHDAYHTGQIIFLRKLQGSWPSRRSFG